LGEGFYKERVLKLAKKHEKTEVKSHLTRHQLSRHRRQQRIQFIIYISGAVFFALLICFIGYGYWDVQIKPYRLQVAKINGTTYDMDYYLKMLELYSKGQDATKTATLADNLIKTIEYNQALIKAAPELGVTVTSDDISSMLKKASLPDEQVYRDAAEATLLTDKLGTDYFDKEVPTSTEQVRAQALFVESTEMAEKVAARLAVTDNFTEAAKEFSLESITRDNGGDLGWLPKGHLDISLGTLGNGALNNILFTLQPGVLSQPTFDGTVSKSLGYWVVQVTENDPTNGKHVRGILTGSRHDGDAIRTKILDGEDFATLVRDYSQDKSISDNVGYLGWLGQGISNRTINALAMPLEPGDVSQPGADSSVQTVGGYWLARVLEKDENRALDTSTRQRIASGLFQNWIVGKMKNDSVQTLITEDKKAWALSLVNKTKGQ
jgi:parvulin-like peptidyl-prolyl isomerase